MAFTGQDADGAQQDMRDRRARHPRRDRAESARRDVDNGPSIKSANTVSMMACWRSVTSASAAG
jgi:hypothetical protein